MGDVFFTTGGRIAKIVSEFNYGDLYKYIGAVWNGTTWTAARFQENGTSITGAADNYAASLDNWLMYYHFNLKYNVTEKNWEGTGNHISNGQLNVKIVKYADPEKVLVELKKAAFEKMVDFIKPLGYSIEMVDV